MPDAVWKAAEDSANEALETRIDIISGTMLGRPYLADPLGEGAQTDPDPMVRYDTFDCLTYVEEVLALTLTADPAAAGPVRRDLRYGTEVSYVQRNHFMELQWIPRALEAGWLRDSTGDHGTPTELRKDVDPGMWANWAGRKKFAHRDAELPVGEMQLQVLDLDQAIAAAPQLPAGTILLTVRADRSWKPIWISHLGIVVPGDRPTVRHATKMGTGATRDHGLVWYLEHLKTYENWPSVGVSLLQPVEFGPRLSRLPESERNALLR